MPGPFFIPDVSRWQGPRPNFAAIAALPDHVGCIVKATQGVHFAPAWFAENWPRVRASGGPRYGRSWFRGCFHYAEPTASGTAQADYLLRAVDRAGGWGDGDMPPAWDLEGDKWTSRQQIVDISSQFAERIKQALGKAPILYTGSTWREFGVMESAGFAALWTPHVDRMVPFGWPRERIILHQYVGTGKYYDPSGQPAQRNYPIGVPGLAPSADMNVVLDGGEPATSIDRVRALLLGAPARRSSFGISTPVVIGVGAGLLALGIMIASAGSDELM